LFRGGANHATPYGQINSNSKVNGYADRSGVLPPASRRQSGRNRQVTVRQRGFGHGTCVLRKKHLDARIAAIMANKDPSKTEQATSKRIEETRAEGKVMTSQDVSALVVTLTGVLLMFLTVPMTTAAFRNMWQRIMLTDCRATWTSADYYRGALSGGVIFLQVLGPILFGLCLSAVIVMRVQVGSYFSMKALEWKFDKLNPVGGWKGLMPDKKKITDLGLTVAKLSVISLIIYLDVRKNLDAIVALAGIPIGAGMTWMMQRFTVITFKVLAFFIVIAAVDYVLKRKEYFDNLMMSKQEVKDERKMADGNPQVKAKIRQKMMSMAMNRMAAEVPKADVVITNPTHVAVALRYVSGEHAPRVVAKGLRKRAQLIKQIARGANVPILEIPPLARSLYRDTQVGGFISPDFYSAVATVLARLQQAGRKIIA